MPRFLHFFTLLSPTQCRCLCFRRWMIGCLKIEGCRRIDIDIATLTISKMKSIPLLEVFPTCIELHRTFWQCFLFGRLGPLPSPLSAGRTCEHASIKRPWLLASSVESMTTSRSRELHRGNRQFEAAHFEKMMVADSSLLGLVNSAELVPIYVWSGLCSAIDNFSTATFYMGSAARGDAADDTKSTEALDEVVISKDASEYEIRLQ